MSNATYTLGSTCALLIITLASGDRITTEIPRGPSHKWLINGLLKAGHDHRTYRAYIAGAVVIDGTEVYQYTANEALEILGLED